MSSYINIIIGGEKMILTAQTSAVRSKNQSDPKQLERYISEIAKGNKDSLAMLYEETRTAVYGFSLSILKNSHDAEDVFQNTYINVYQSAPRYVFQGKPMAWIFTIARNLSLMKIREYQKISDIPQDEWENRFIINEKYASDDKMVLDAVMCSLKEEERQIIMLHAISGFKHREIADILKLPLSTVLSKYNRGIKK